MEIKSKPVGHYIEGSWAEIPGDAVSKDQIGELASTLLKEVIEGELGKTDRKLQDPEPAVDGEIALYANPPYDTDAARNNAARQIHRRWQRCLGTIAADIRPHVDTFRPV